MPARRMRERRDRELTPGLKRRRERNRREVEITSQIVNALEKGNPVERLLTHPAGLLGKGSCAWLHEDREDEIRHIREEYAKWQRRFEEGTELEDLDADVAGRIRAGKRKGDRDVDELAAIKIRAIAGRRGQQNIGPFPRARGVKDHVQYHYQEEGIRRGWMQEMTQEDELAEHEARLEKTLEAINKDRIRLGLNPMRFEEDV